ncbi:hemophore-related protein [Nocardia aurantia]|uniref:Hemophore-related protein n=1 Tax=Nocardia aurantia TaxID=2585199 RepID=A0A7K0DLI1_9NOCA|nr:hemophore-related protein [Nocardia aurantia]MQY26152.1 hypothetical protein [Nocardia aurantia]
MAVSGMSARSARVAGGLAIAGAIGVAGLLVPAVGAAQPPAGAEFLRTTCNAAQVESALHEHAPDLAARVDAHPEFKSRLDELLNLPPAERQQRIESFRQQHPDLGGNRPMPQGVDSGAVRGELQQVLDTCHNY